MKNVTDTSIAARVDRRLLDEGPVHEPRGREEHVVSDRIALLDWDNTLHSGFTMTRWANFLSERGLFPAVMAAEISTLAQEYAAGTLPYIRLTEELPALYAEGLAGQDKVKVDLATESFLRIDHEGIYPFVRPLLGILRTLGLRIVVVSGCPAEPLTAYQSVLGIDDVYALTVAHSSHLYLNHISLNPTTGPGKQAVVDGLMAEDASIVFAIGDSSADLPLLDAAAYKVVVDNPSLVPQGANVGHLAARDGLTSIDWLDQFLAPIRS